MSYSITCYYSREVSLRWSFRKLLLSQQHTPMVIVRTALLDDVQQLSRNTKNCSVVAISFDTMQAAARYITSHTRLCCTY
jgi:hypothetical protein